MLRCRMFKVIPFKKEHIEVMDVRDHESNILNNDVLSKLEKTSIAFTGVVNGKIISCGGIIVVFKGVAELWQIPSIYVSEITIKYARYIRKWIELMRQEFQLYRMETICLDDDLHNRWMRFLGFEREGVKRKFLNGHDYVMFGKIWEEQV